MTQSLNLSSSFLLALISTPMLAMSSKSLIMLWILMEINNMAFIYLIVLSDKSNYHMPMNFFIIQNISSLSVIIYIMMNHKTFQENLEMEMNFILMMGLSMKMSLPPFHTWMIKMSKTASWNMNILFITWQKIIPIFILTKFQNFMLIPISMLFLMMGTLLQFMFIKIKPLIISSSIAHMGWMIIPQSFSKMFPFFYLLVYTSIITPLIAIFKKNNKWKLMKMTQKNNFILMMNIFNLSSIPPLTGFILKWIIFSLLLQQKLNMVCLSSMFITTTISFYIYFQIMYNILLKTYIKKKLKMHTNMSNLNYVSFMTMTILPIIMIM